MTSNNKIVPIPPKEILECEKIFKGDCLSFDLSELRDDKGNPRPRYCPNVTLDLLLKYVFLPSLFCIYPVVLMFWSCINWDTSGPIALFWCVFSIYVAGLLLLMFKMGCFVQSAKFCFKTHRDTHKLLHWGIFFIYSSILLAYELYAYTGNFFAGFSAFAFWGLYVLLYFPVFLEGHVHPCKALLKEDAPKKAVNKCILISTWAVHLSLLIVCVVFNSQLYDTWRDAKELNGDCLVPV